MIIEEISKTTIEETGEIMAIEAISITIEEILLKTIEGSLIITEEIRMKIIIEGLIIIAIIIIISSSKGREEICHGLKMYRL